MAYVIELASVVLADVIHVTVRANFGRVPENVG